MNLPQPQQLIPVMAQQLQQHLTQQGINQPRFVSIHTGGVWVANALLAEMQLTEQPLGTLNVSFYRDDFSRKGLHPLVRPSQLPFDVEGEHLVLVDDVLMSGRTIRAALNELFDYGRPASVTLVCMLDLNARELPIRPDIVGATLTLAPEQRVKLTGPEPLAVELRQLT